RDLLRGARRILIVDDVVHTGSRLTAFTRALREEHGRVEKLCIAVAVARMESDEEFEDLKKRVTAGHTWSGSLVALEQVAIPAWGADDCPWCREYELLSAVSERFATPASWLVDRVAVLAQRETGIHEESLLIL